MADDKKRETETKSFIDETSGVKITFDLQEVSWEENGKKQNFVSMVNIDPTDYTRIEEAAKKYFKEHPEELNKMPAYRRNNVGARYMEIKAQEYLKQKKEKGDVLTPMEADYLRQLTAEEMKEARKEAEKKIEGVKEASQPEKNPTKEEPKEDKKVNSYIDASILKRNEDLLR